MTYTIFNEVVLLALAIILIVVVSLTRVGALWFRLFVIDIFATTILHRLDAISIYVWHVDLINPGVTYVLNYLVLGAGLLAFVAAYQRRRYLMRAERMRRLDTLRKSQPIIDQLERQRSKSENGIPWDLEHRLIT